LNYGTADQPARLYTFIDLSDAEQDDVEAGRRDLRAEFDAAVARIEPIIAAIGEQTQEFCAQDLNDGLTDAIAARKRQMRNRAAISRQLSWPSEWKQTVPTLDVKESAVVDDSPVNGGSIPGADTPAVGAEGEVVELRHKERLSPATFEDVQHTMRVWADAVEKYPRAFAALSEDRLSDLLAATLNAALPGAHREVYRRSGKTDIYVTADVIAEGTGPGKVFIAECKKWRGGKGVGEGYQQLLRYLNSQDTAAFLLVFNETLGAGQAQEKALTTLKSEEGYGGINLHGPAGWPILTFTTKHDQQLELCVAVVNIDEPDRPPRRKSHGKGASGKSEGTPST